jgi:hypothetical protein
VRGVDIAKKKPCVHHWVLDEGKTREIPAVCKLCGEKTVFAGNQWIGLLDMPTLTQMKKELGEVPGVEPKSGRKRGWGWVGGPSEIA